MKLRRILTLTAVSVLLLLLVAYAGFVRDSTPEQPQQEENEAVLRILAPYEIQKHREALLNLAEEYSAVPGHKKAEIEFISAENYKKEIGMRSDMAENADIIICDNVIMPALIDMGVFVDITDELGREITAVYYPTLWENTKSDGKIYGMPFTFDPYVLFYNEALLEKYDVDPPETWEELATACDSVEGLGNYGIGFAAKYSEEATACYMQILYAAGGTLREINGDSGLKTLELLAGFARRRQIPEDAINWSSTDMAFMYAKGNIALMMNKMSSAEILRSADGNLRVQSTVLPMDRKYAYLLHGENIGITTTADYESALDFLLYLSQVETAEKVAEGLDTIPVLIEAKYRQKEMGLSEADCLTEVQYGVSKSSYGSWFDISAAISDGIYRILSDPEASVEKTANEMQDKVRMAIIDK